MPTENTTEEWRIHPDHFGYQISSHGKVRSFWKQVARGQGCFRNELSHWPRVLKPTKADKCGHLAVSLQGKQHRYVHHLVLEVFVGKCPDGMECRHLDNNPANNRLENLSWGTKSQNTMDKVLANNHCNQKLSQEDVIEIRKLRGEGVTGRKVAIQFGVSAALVCCIFKRKRWGWIE